MLSRGVRLPTTITSDGAPGLIKAIPDVLPGQHPDPLLVPPASQHPGKLPDEAAAEVMAHVYAVRDAPTFDAARVAADRLANTFGRQGRSRCGRVWSAPTGPT